MRQHKKSFFFTILTLVLLIFLTACGTDSSSRHKNDNDGILSRDNLISHDGLTRTYDYYLPGNLGGGPVPLVFLLHGRGANADNMTGAFFTKAPFKIWLDLADQHQFIVVVPEGVEGSDGKNAWNDCRSDATNNPDTDDVGFINALIDDFQANYTVDPSRIYVHGSSTGGMMALRLALELSDRIAAVATVIAAMPASSECTGPVNPTPVLFMNGTLDPFVPYSGGSAASGTVLSVAASVNFWITFNGASTDPVITDIADINLQDDSQVIKYAYSNGTENTDVVLYKVVGGGHTEPSIQEEYSAIYEAIAGKQNHDIEMAEEAYTFLFSHTLN